MSELESVCHALDASVQQLPSLAESMRQRASRLRSLAAELQTARSRVRCNCGPDVGRTVQALAEAAAAADASAQALLAATQQGKSYVARTIGGGGSLSQADRDALSDITGSGHQSINRALDGGTLDEVEAVASRATAVSRALEQLPIHEGTVLRGSAGNLSASDIAKYEPGEVRIEDRFLHTSVDPEVADGKFHGNVLWIIESKHGHDVHAHSAWESEREVMFDKASKFEVLSKQQIEETGQWLIYMQEV